MMRRLADWCADAYLDLRYRLCRLVTPPWRTTIFGTPVCEKWRRWPDA